MEKKVLIVISAVIAAIGVVNIFSPWYRLSSDYAEMMFDYVYNGVNVWTSGDFTSPSGIFYGLGGTGGAYSPTITAIAFLVIFARFLLKMEEEYLPTVSVPGVLIVIGAVYSIFWIDPGTRYHSGCVVTHAFGMGPVLAIVLAAVLMVVAHYLDRGALEKAGIPPQPAAPAAEAPSAPFSDAGEFTVTVKMPKDAVFTENGFLSCELSVDGVTNTVGIAGSKTFPMDAGPHTFLFRQNNINGETIVHEETMVIEDSCTIEIVCEQRNFLFIRKP